MTDSMHRTIAVALTAVALLMLILAPLTLARGELEFRDRDPGVHILDRAGIIDDVVEETVQSRLQGRLEDDGVDIVVFTQRKQPTGGRKGTQADAQRLLEEWQVGGDSGKGAVMLWNTNRSGERTASGVALGKGFSALDLAEVDDAVNAAIKPALNNKDWSAALADGVVELEARTIDALAEPTPRPTRRPTAPGTAAPQRPQVTDGERPTSGLRPAAGPPFPDEIPGVRVYDYAEVMSPEIIVQVSETIARIEER
ncbi:MAG: TPM domain-containing protein, partial [Chloroflexota bacterium]